MEDDRGVRRNHENEARRRNGRRNGHPLGRVLGKTQKSGEFKGGTIIIKKMGVPWFIPPLVYPPGLSLKKMGVAWLILPWLIHLFSLAGSV